LRIPRNIVGQELQGDEAMQLYVLGLVHHTHTTATELLDDAIVRDGLPNHSRESYVREAGKSMKAMELSGPRTDGW
jgi:hypothetical protein